MKKEGDLSESGERRQVKYLNTLVEQDHHCIKWLTKPGMGFFSFESAWRTLQGFEVMNMIRKGQPARSGKRAGCAGRQVVWSGSHKKG